MVVNGCYILQCKLSQALAVFKHGTKPFHCLATIIIMGFLGGGWEGEFDSFVPRPSQLFNVAREWRGGPGI